MSLLGLDAIGSLSARICNDFAIHCPAEILSTESKDRISNKLRTALRSVNSNIAMFLAQNPVPGIVKKAVCANRVKWGLKERGYPKEVASEVAQKVVLALFKHGEKS